LQENEGNHDKQQRRQENTEQENTLLNDLHKLFAQDYQDFVHT
jgi:hypothetical protein